MLFNSIEFALFLPIVFLLYWFVTSNNLRIQNILLLLSSYYFYACWDWRFLFLLIFSTALDYYSGIKIEEASTRCVKKTWLILSISINLGLLGVLKYFNFFSSSLAEGIKQLGLHADPFTLKIILPVGISFYTFHGLSYIIDIYKNKIRAERSIVDYSVFVSFFPLLVAGPIERATHLLPQLKQKRSFDYSQAVDGLRQILWGLFKKIVIADQCAIYADQIFNHSENYTGSTLVLGALFFSIQIYGDFSGYSDIAIGTSRLFGIELLRNFAFPYFSRDVAEFWRRWHISLSMWFKDYLYIPLGGSKAGTWVKIRNTFIIFLVSGFWHGANWTFLVWGFINALYILPSIYLQTNRNNLDIVAQGKYLPTLKEMMNICITFSLVVFAWIIFRAKNITHAWEYISGIFSDSLFSVPSFEGMQNTYFLICLIILFFIVEWIGREKQHALAYLGRQWGRPLRWGMYFILVFFLYLFSGTEQAFIYFQF